MMMMMKSPLVIPPASLILLMFIASSASTSVSASTSREIMLQQEGADITNNNNMMTHQQYKHNTNLDSRTMNKRRRTVTKAAAAAKLEWVQIGNDIEGDSFVGQDNCGRSVAISSNGNRIAIGAPDYSFGGFNNYSTIRARGLVRIYDYKNDSNGQWIQVGNDIHGERAYDKFGYSIAMSSDGNRIAIGTPYNKDNGLLSGHVKMYELNGDVWYQMGRNIDGENEGDYSGYSVAMSSDGGRVAIGARNNDGNGYVSGHVRVYEYDGSNWKQIGDDIDGEAETNASGESVAMSSDGSRVIIGAPLNDWYNTKNWYNSTRSGHVRIYEYDGSAAWNQIGGDIDGKQKLENFGESVAMSSDGNRVAVGAPYNDGNVHPGHIRVYEYDGSVWNQVGQDIDSEEVDAQDTAKTKGISVSMSSDGNRIVIGSFKWFTNYDTGHVSIYEFDGDIWIKVGNEIDGENNGDKFGRSVAMSSDGNRVVVGAPDHDQSKLYSDDRGRVQVFQIMEIPTQPPSTSPQPSLSFSTPPSVTPSSTASLQPSPVGVSIQPSLSPSLAISQQPSISLSSSSFQAFSSSKTGIIVASIIMGVLILS